MKRFLRILELLNSFAEKDDFTLRWYNATLPANVWEEIGSMEKSLPSFNDTDFNSPDDLACWLNIILNHIKDDGKDMHIFRILVFFNYSMLLFRELFPSSPAETGFIIRISNLIYLSTDFNPNKRMYRWIYFILYYAGFY